MHVTQTYLGRYGESGLFVYYLYEDYAADQMSLTQKVQDALDDIGADYLDEVDLFRPNERFAGDIASEVRKLPAVWDYCSGKLPGFLVTYVPLRDVNPNNDTVIFFSIQGRSESEAIDVVKKIRRPIKEAKPIECGNEFVARFTNALEVKPGLFGVSLDFKRLFKF